MRGIGVDAVATRDAEDSRADLLKRCAEAQISRKDLDRWMQEGVALDADAVVAICLTDLAAAAR